MQRIQDRQTADWRKSPAALDIEHVLDVEPRRFRPKSTLEGDNGAWGVYWLLEGLERLAAPIPIAELRAYGTGKPFGKGFVLRDRYGWGAKVLEVQHGRGAESGGGEGDAVRPDQGRLW